MQQSLTSAKKSQKKASGGMRTPSKKMRGNQLWQFVETNRTWRAAAAKKDSPTQEALDSDYLSQSSHSQTSLKTAPQPMSMLARSKRISKRQDRVVAE